MSSLKVIFDGDCNMCNGVVRLLMKADKKLRLTFIASQSEEGKALLGRIAMPSPESIIVLENGLVFTESDAVVKALSVLPLPWKLFSCIKYLPLSIRNYIYRLIAKNRYAIFGRAASCELPDKKS